MRISDWSSDVCSSDLPFPGPEPFPQLPDIAPLSPPLLRTRARAIQQRRTTLDLAAVPPELLHQDYLALRTLSVDAARIYVHARPYPFPLFCQCRQRAVGRSDAGRGGKGGVRKDRYQ